MNLAWILLMRNISDQIKVRFQAQTTVVPSEAGGAGAPPSMCSRQGNSSRVIINMAEEPPQVSYIRDILHSINNDLKVKQTFGKMISESEIVAFENIARRYNKLNVGRPRYEPEYWIPIQWASRLIHKCFLHGYISDPRTMNNMNEEVEELREDMQKLEIYSNILIPLVYTQVVVIAVYSYFVVHLFASQFLDPKQKIDGHELDFYVPVFTIFQFMFMMGWLKVAMCVMNPFGDDDEDFRTGEMLDYNLDISWRCTEAPEDCFPALLHPAPMQFRVPDEQDNLMEFLDEADNAPSLPNNNSSLPTDKHSDKLKPCPKAKLPNNHLNLLERLQRTFPNSCFNLRSNRDNSNNIENLSTTFGNEFSIMCSKFDESQSALINSNIKETPLIV